MNNTESYKNKCNKMYNSKHEFPLLKILRVVTKKTTKT